jgi:hypothetical protein
MDAPMGGASRVIVPEGTSPSASGNTVTANSNVGNLSVVGVADNTSTDGLVAGNSVEIESGGIVGAIQGYGHVYGGVINDGAAIDNNVIMTGGKVSIGAIKNRQPYSEVFKPVSWTVCCSSFFGLSLKLMLCLVVGHFVIDEETSNSRQVAAVFAVPAHAAIHLLPLGDEKIIFFFPRLLDVLIPSICHKTSQGMQLRTYSK